MSLEVIEGHWRLTQINFKPVQLIQSHMSDGLDGMGLVGWMVIIGRRQSKSTFGTKNYNDKNKNNNFYEVVENDARHPELTENLDW